MKLARSVFFASLAALAILAEAHHEASPERREHAAAFRASVPAAGPGAFISVFAGGSFSLPTAVP